MKIGPKTRQRLYLFIEKEHGPGSIRMMWLIVSGLLGVLRAPQSLKAMMREEVFAGDFKTPVRRLNWLLRYSRLKKTLFRDDFFDFSLGLDRNAAIAVYETFDGYAEFGIEDHIHLAQLASRVIESQLAPGQSLDIQDDVSSQKYDRLYQHHLKLALERVDLSEQQAKPDKVSVSSHADARAELKSSKPFSQSTLAQDVFVDAIAFMDKHQPRVYAVSGTLLGIVREGRLLAHDIDIDLGVMAEDLDADKLLRAFAASDKFYLKKVDYPVFRVSSDRGVRYSRMSMPSLIKFGHKRGLHIDLFVHFDDNGVRWHGSSLHRWDNSGFELEQTSFMGIDVCIPTEPERYLEENYGDWQTPKIDFNCSIDTPNIALQSSCKTICYFVKLLHFYRAKPEISSRILSLLTTQDIIMPGDLTKPVLTQEESMNG